MKIKKEFLPLILNGKKRYEFIFEEPYKIEGLYNVNGKTYNLVKLCRFTFLDLRINGIKSETAFIKELKDVLIYPLDSLTVKYLKENKYYKRIREHEQLYIYEWVEFKPQELEII